MPANRFLYPSCGHSAKVTSLSDLEFRVWTQYLLSADDYGVMRMSALVVQADNDALASKPAKSIHKCLERLVSLGLVRSFKHQDRTYIYQHDWQEYQNIRYPRQSHDPIPPPEMIAACDESTRMLFGIKVKQSGKTFVDPPKDSGNVSEIVPSPARAGGRETLTANANGAIPTADAIAMRAGAFAEHYADLHERFVGSAYLGNARKDYEAGLQLCDRWTDAELHDMAIVWFGVDDDFATNGTRTIPKFASRATWCAQQVKTRGIA